MFFILGVAECSPLICRVIINRLILGGSDILFPSGYDRQYSALRYSPAICFEGLYKAGFATETGAKCRRYFKNRIPPAAALLKVGWNGKAP